MTNIWEGVEKLGSKLKGLGIPTPTCHLVLGSVTAHVLNEKSAGQNWEKVVEIPFSAIPGLIQSTAPGHSGKFCYFKNKKSGKFMCVQQGRLHGYEGLDPQTVIAPLMIHRHLGCHNFILTNAAGSLQTSIGPNNIVFLKDHVNLTGKNPLAGPNPVDANGKPIGPRFPDMGHIYDKELRQRFENQFKSKFKTHQGVYLGVLGPSFETPSEVLLFSSWGLHAVGMSTVWEAIALKHSGARILGISLITNYGCGLVSDEVLDHHKFEAQLTKMAEQFVETLLETVSFEVMQ